MGKIKRNEKLMLALVILDCVKHHSDITHIAGPIFHVDLGHVGYMTKAFHAVSLPGPHWF